MNDVASDTHPHTPALPLFLTPTTTITTLSNATARLSFYPSSSCALRDYLSLFNYSILVSLFLFLIRDTCTPVKVARGGLPASFPYATLLPRLEHGYGSLSQRAFHIRCGSCVATSIIPPCARDPTP